MTAKEFNTTSFSKETKIIYKGEVYSLLAVDFQWGEFKLKSGDGKAIESVPYYLCLTTQQVKP
jgi:hypothetical protein